MKKLAALFMMTLSIVVLSACGKQEVQPTETEAQTEQVVTMTVLEYQSKIRDVFDQINTIIDKSDMETAKGVQTLVSLVEPLYAEIDALVPPAKLADADAKLKEGCKKTLEALKLSEDILMVGDNPTADDVAKVSQLQSAIDQMTSINAQMDSALDTIYHATSD